MRILPQRERDPSKDPAAERKREKEKVGEGEGESWRRRRRVKLNKGRRLKASSLI